MSKLILITCLFAPIFNVATASAMQVDLAGVQIGEVDRLTNTNVTTDITDADDQLLLINLKISYESSVRGATTEDFRVTLATVGDTLNQLCKDAGATKLESYNFATDSADEDYEERVMAVTATGGRLTYRYYSSKLAKRVSEVVCLK